MFTSLSCSCPLNSELYVSISEITSDSTEADRGSSKRGVFPKLDSTEKSVTNSANCLLHRLQIPTPK